MRVSCCLVLLIGLVFALPGIAHAKPQGTVPGDISLFMVKSGTGSDRTGVNNIYASLGDTISIDVFIKNYSQVPISAIEVYLTIDSKYFGVVGQGVNEEENKYKGEKKPFIQGEYMKNAYGSVPPYGNNMAGDKLSDLDNGRSGWQLNYVEITGPNVGFGRPVSKLLYGVVCTFKLIALAPCDSVKLLLDADFFNMRVSQYYNPNSSDSFSFQYNYPTYIYVSGITIYPPLPDLLMAPGTADSTLDLDDHVGLSSIPDSAFVWKASGNDKITVSIHPKTHVVTFTAPQDFHGYEDITFTVGSEAEPDMAADVLRVTVDSPPSFIKTAIPDTIYIHEDLLETVFYLPGIVRDDDDAFSTLKWDFSTGKNLTWYIFGAQFDTLKLQGVLNFNGIDRLAMTVSDTFGLKDSITRPVVVYPVNDPPVLAGLPDVEFERTKSYTLDFKDYAYDVDGDIMLLTYVPLKNFIVQFSDMVVTFREVPGYIGSEDVIFTVTDRFGLSDSDTMKVTVTPLKNPPEWSKILKIGFPQNESFSDLILWAYVNDPDGADSDLKFVFSGYSEVDSIYVSPGDGRLYLYDLDNKPGWEWITVKAIDVDKNEVSTRFRVFIGPSDGTPIVADIPDTTIRAGSRFEWVDLDEYYYDINNSDEEMRWTWSHAGRDSLVLIDINFMSHLATLTTINPDSSGTDKVLFTVTDPGGKSAGDDSSIRVIGSGEGPVLDLPSKVGFVTGVKAVIDLDRYVFDPNFPDSVHTWAWSGNRDIQIDYEGEYQGYTRPLYFTSANGWAGWERVSFYVRNPFGDSTQDSTLVFSVPEDGSPVAGGLDQVSLKAGSCDSLNIDLDDFYYDTDTPERLMQWTVSGKDSITVYIDPITHVVRFCSLSETFEGEEVITLTVSDGVHSSYMNVKVVVYGAVVRNVFTMHLFRNPMQGDYMDIYVKSRVELAKNPSLEIRVEGNTTFVSMTSLSDTLNYYYGKYLLPYKASLGLQRDAVVLARGTTTKNKAIEDTLTFVYGRLGAGGGKLVLGPLTLTIPEGALNEPELVTIVPEQREINDGSAEKTAGDELVLSKTAYNIGLASLMTEKPMGISFALCCRSEGAGIFRMNSDGWEYAGSVSSNNTVHADISVGGIYCLGYDRVSPHIEEVRVTDGRLVFTAVDHGSGINPESVIIKYDNMPVKYVYDAQTSVFTVDLSGLTPSSSSAVRIEVSDRVGNTAVETVNAGGLGQEQFTVYQNVPNPFNPSTTLSFFTKDSQRITIEIFDILGRRVRVLADGFYPSGNHNVVWDARDDSGQTISSGTYFYKISGVRHAVVRKMVFIR